MRNNISPKMIYATDDCRWAEESSSSSSSRETENEASIQWETFFAKMNLRTCNESLNENKI